MFELKPIPYAMDALEPVISAQTLSFHYGKHLTAYVDNLNKLLPGSGFDGSSLEEIVCKSSGAIFNNAGQILNHNLYFEQFAAKPQLPAPMGNLFAQIEKQWSLFAAFQEEFVAKGVSLLGSGWVWLSAQEDGTLVITQEGPAGNPVTRGLKPILTFDVWEHAYYLDYQNRRADYLNALWRILEWRVVEERYLK